MKTLGKILRRFRLGKKYKHQDTCHSSFNIIRNNKNFTITWENKVIANIGMVSTLKNKFSTSCFTIATGPSLNDIDLTKMATYDSVSLNCAIHRLSNDNIKPTHCLIVDHRVFENHWDCVKESILSGAYCYFSYVGLSRICEREPQLLNYDNIFLIENIDRKFGIARPSLNEFQQTYNNDPDIFLDPNFSARGTIGFSNDAEKGFFSGKTVATWAVQLARYLGYQTNFIIGMDLGGTGKTHFYNNAGNRPPDFMRDYEPYIRVCFEQARRSSEQLGFSIYNLSEQSSLPHEIIPKISYDEALSLAANNQESI